MKLNTRVLALSLAFGAVAAAQAQNVTFKLVYADAIGAGLNGAAIGDELSSITKVGAIGTSFGVALVATSNVDARYGAGGMMVCFDTATTNNTNYGTQAAAETAGTFDKIGLGPVPAGLTAGQAEYPLVTNAGDDAGTGALAWLNRNYAGSFGSTTASLRPIGLWAAFNFGTGLALNMPNGSSVAIAKFNVTNRGIAAGDIYGDNGSETGVMIFGATNASTRSTYLGATTGAAQQQGQKKYALQAVPEPGSIIAIATGLAAVAARRRRK
jgi:hypothetical protein